MKHLRHPVRSIREPFGKAGLIVACLALVMALTGAAFAAGGLTKSQEKQVKKIAKKEAKKYAGKPGAPGATGPAGPAGAAGKDGTNGTNGKDGTNGTNGTNGKSVTVTEIPIEEAECEERGGVMVAEEDSASGVEVCNGEKGAEGSPWTAGGTLPPGATETGSWGANGPGPETAIGIPISFPIPLATKLKWFQVHVAGEPNFSNFCTGSNFQHPEASPGELCLYTSELHEAEILNITGNFYPEREPLSGGTGVFGAVVDVAMTNGSSLAFGSFAVTGCTAETGKQDSCPSEP